MSNNESSNAVSLSDHSTLRDEEGRRLPKWTHVDFLGGDIESKPLTKAQKEEYRTAIDESDDPDDEVLIPSELSSRVFDDVLVTPHPRDDDDLHTDEYTEEYIDEDLNDDAEIGLWIGILRNSGMDEAADFLEALATRDMEYLSEAVEKANAMGNLEGVDSEE